MKRKVFKIKVQDDIINGGFPKAQGECDFKIIGETEKRKTVKAPKHQMNRDSKTNVGKESKEKQTTRVFYSHCPVVLCTG